MAFENRLKELRSQKGLTMKNLAEELNVNYTTYVNWEKGKSPSFEKIADIANYFNVSTDYLLDLTIRKTIDDDFEKAKNYAEKAGFTITDSKTFIDKYNHPSFAKKENNRKRLVTRPLTEQENRDDSGLIFIYDETKAVKNLRFPYTLSTKNVFTEKILGTIEQAEQLKEDTILERIKILYTKEKNPLTQSDITDFLNEFFDD